MGEIGIMGVQIIDEKKERGLDGSGHMFLEAFVDPGIYEVGRRRQRRSQEVGKGILLPRIIFETAQSIRQKAPVQTIRWGLGLEGIEAKVELEESVDERIGTDPVRAIAGLLEVGDEAAVDP